MRQTRPLAAGGLRGAPWREPPPEGAGPTKPASWEDSGVGVGVAWQAGAQLEAQEEEEAAGKREPKSRRGRGLASVGF